MSVRAFPMPVFPKEGRPANWCRWCGLEIIHGRAASRGWHDGREDEPKCKQAWQLHTDRREQFPFIEGRDGLKCWDCKESPEKWIRSQGPTYVHRPPWVDRNDPRVAYVGEYWTITRATALELEHATPLWAISHLPDDERRFYFGPGNLRLRCPACHSAKTKRESGDRAKMKRLEKYRLENIDAPPTAEPWPKPRKGTIQSRGFGPSRGFEKGPKRPIPSRKMRS